MERSSAVVFVSVRLARQHVVVKMLLELFDGLPQTGIQDDAAILEDFCQAELGEASGACGVDSFAGGFRGDGCARYSEKFVAQDLVGRSQKTASDCKRSWASCGA